MPGLVLLGLALLALGGVSGSKQKTDPGVELYNDTLACNLKLKGDSLVSLGHTSDASTCFQWAIRWRNVIATHGRCQSACYFQDPKNAR